MNKYFYPIFKLPTFYERDYVKEELPLWIKWWLLGKAGRELSEILTGSEFTLLHTLNKKFKLLQINGRTEQEQLSGKNLLEIKNTSRTINGVTFTINADKSITMNGTATDRIVFPLNSNTDYVLQNLSLKENTTYTLSYNISSSVQNVFPQIYYNKNEQGAYSTNTFTTVEATNSAIYIIVYSGTVINNATIQVQLEEGSQATSYEPYCRTEYQAQTHNFHNLLKM